MTVLAATTSTDRVEFVLFWLLAGVSLATAVLMVLNRRAIYSALLLVVNFFCLAVLYLLLDAQFLAAVQVIVYAGAIMVLFLFVLMLLGDRQELAQETIRGQRIVAAVLGLLLVAGVGFALLKATGGGGASFAGLTAANNGDNVAAVGRLLYTKYIFAFESVGVLLVVAAVGALVLGKRRP